MRIKVWAIVHGWLGHDESFPIPELQPRIYRNGSIKFTPSPLADSPEVPSILHHKDELILLFDTERTVGHTKYVFGHYGYGDPDLTRVFAGDFKVERLIIANEELKGEAVVDEKLKEFALTYRRSPEAYLYGSGPDRDPLNLEAQEIKFAQAVADFTEKRVLEELKAEIVANETEIVNPNADEDIVIKGVLMYNQTPIQIINQRLAALDKTEILVQYVSEPLPKKGEKDGKD